MTKAKSVQNTSKQKQQPNTSSPSSSFPSSELINPIPSQDSSTYQSLKNNSHKAVPPLASANRNNLSSQMNGQQLQQYTANNTSSNPSQKFHLKGSTLTLSKGNNNNNNNTPSQTSQSMQLQQSGSTSNSSRNYQLTSIYQVRPTIAGTASSQTSQNSLLAQSNTNHVHNNKHLLHEGQAAAQYSARSRFSQIGTSSSSVSSPSSLFSSSANPASTTTTSSSMGSLFPSMSGTSSSSSQMTTGTAGTSLIKQTNYEPNMHALKRFVISAYFIYDLIMLICVEGISKEQVTLLLLFIGGTALDLIVLNDVYVFNSHLIHARMLAHDLIDQITSQKERDILGIFTQPNHHTIGANSLSNGGVGGVNAFESAAASATATKNSSFPSQFLDTCIGTFLMCYRIFRIYSVSKKWHPTYKRMYKSLFAPNQSQQSTSALSSYPSPEKDEQEEREFQLRDEDGQDQEQVGIGSIKQKEDNRMLTHMFNDEINISKSIKGRELNSMSKASNEPKETIGIMQQAKSENHTNSISLEPMYPLANEITNPINSIAQEVKEKAHEVHVDSKEQKQKQSSKKLIADDKSENNNLTTQTELNNRNNNPQSNQKGKRHIDSPQIQLNSDQQSKQFQICDNNNKTTVASKSNNKVEVNVKQNNNIPTINGRGRGRETVDEKEKQEIDSPQKQAIPTRILSSNERSEITSITSESKYLDQMNGIELKQIELETTTQVESKERIQVKNGKLIDHTIKSIKNDNYLNRQNHEISNELKVPANPIKQSKSQSPQPILHSNDQNLTHFQTSNSISKQNQKDGNTGDGVASKSIKKADIFEKKKKQESLQVIVAAQNKEIIGENPINNNKKSTLDSKSQSPQLKSTQTTKFEKISFKKVEQPDESTPPNKTNQRIEINSEEKVEQINESNYLININVSSSQKQDTYIEAVEEKQGQDLSENVELDFLSNPILEILSLPFRDPVAYLAQLQSQSQLNTIKNKPLASGYRKSSLAIPLHSNSFQKNNGISEQNEGIRKRKMTVNDEVGQVQPQIILTQYGWRKFQSNDKMQSKMKMYNQPKQIEFQYPQFYYENSQSNLSLNAGESEPLEDLERKYLLSAESTSNPMNGFLPSSPHDKSFYSNNDDSSYSIIRGGVGFAAAAGGISRKSSYISQPAALNIPIFTLTPPMPSPPPLFTQFEQCEPALTIEIKTENNKSFTATLDKNFQINDRFEYDCYEHGLSQEEISALKIRILLEQLQSEENNPLFSEKITSKLISQASAIAQRVCSEVLSESAYLEVHQAISSSLTHVPQQQQLQQQSQQQQQPFQQQFQQFSIQQTDTEQFDSVSSFDQKYSASKQSYPLQIDFPYSLGPSPIKQLDERPRSPMIPDYFEHLQTPNFINPMPPGSTPFLDFNRTDTLQPMHGFEPLSIQRKTSNRSSQSTNAFAHKTSEDLSDFQKYYLQEMNHGRNQPANTMYWQNQQQQQQQLQSQSQAQISKDKDMFNMEKTYSSSAKKLRQPIPINGTNRYMVGGSMMPGYSNQFNPNGNSNHMNPRKYSENITSAQNVNRHWFNYSQPPTQQQLFDASSPNIYSNMNAQQIRPQIFSSELLNNLAQLGN